MAGGKAERMQFHHHRATRPHRAGSEKVFWVPATWSRGAGRSKLHVVSNYDVAAFFDDIGISAYCAREISGRELSPVGRV